MADYDAEAARRHQAAKMRKRRADPVKRERDRQGTKANQVTMRRLAARHVDEYLGLLDEVRAEMGLPPANRHNVLGRLGRQEARS